MPAQLHNITDRFNGINCLEPIPPWRLVKLAMENVKLGFKICGPTDVPCGIWKTTGDTSLRKLRGTIQWQPFSTTLSICVNGTNAG